MLKLQYSIVVTYNKYSIYFFFRKIMKGPSNTVQNKQYMHTTQNN